MSIIFSDSCCPKERWLPVSGFGGGYLISSCGRLKYRKKDQWHDLKIREKRYHQVALWKNKKYFYPYVHRLVYLTFLGNIPSGREIDHIDRCAHNNHLSNLRLATRSQNCVNRKNLNSGIFSRPSKSLPFRARIGVNGEAKFLGNFSSLKKAREARRAAEIKYYGEFSNKF